MKKRIYVLLLCVLVGISFGAANVVFAAESHVVPYPAGYVITNEGASSYNGIGNVASSLASSNKQTAAGLPL